MTTEDFVDEINSEILPEGDDDGDWEDDPYEDWGKDRLHHSSDSQKDRRGEQDIDEAAHQTDAALGKSMSYEGETILVDERYAVRMSVPIPDLDSPHAQAFVCQDENQPDIACFALVNNGLLPGRSQDLNLFRHVKSNSVLRPLAWSVIPWLDKKQKRFVTIVERPGGARVSTELGHNFKPIREENLVRMLFSPCVNLMNALGQSLTTYRSIRFNNLFFKDIQRKVIVLGEAYTVPPAMDQPVLYESYDSAMAEPGGRGQGSLRDDIYSLGVLMAVFLRGGEPFSDKSDEEIIEIKIRDGSFNTMLAGVRLSLGMSELLRGMLADDPNDRFLPKDLDAWMNGRRNPSRQRRGILKSERALALKGVEVFDVRHLSYRLTRDWSEGIQAMSESPIEVWLNRSFEDENIGAQFLSALHSASAFGSRGQVEDGMLARGVMVLDPQAPIRYRNFSARWDGIASALMTRMIQNGDVNPILSVILMKLPQFWAEKQANETANASMIIDTMDKVGRWLLSKEIGFGVERALYELNPHCPCLSPLLSQHYVLGVEHIFPALEAVAIERNGLGEPMDTHLAAFLAARVSHRLDSFMAGLSDPIGSSERNMAIIRLLAEIEQVTDMQTPQNVMKWAGRLAEPVIESYRARSFRERLTRDVGKILREGKLSDLTFILDNSVQRQRDADGYSEAVSNYVEAEREIHEITSGERMNPDVIERRGQEFATMAAAAVASFSLIVILLGYMALGKF